MVELLDDLSDDWTCGNCGNDKLNGSIEFDEKTQTNLRVFYCSKCGQKIAKEII